MTGNAGAALRDREVLEHVRRSIVRDRLTGGDPVKGSAATTAALELTDAAAMAFRIAGTPPPGTATHRDAAAGAFMRATGNLDTAVQNLAVHVPGAHSARLTAAQAGLEPAGLVGAGFPPDSVLEAILQPAPHPAAPRRTPHQQGELSR